jgi:hypothetical protein
VRDKGEDKGGCSFGDKTAEFAIPDSPIADGIIGELEDNEDQEREDIDVNRKLAAFTLQGCDGPFNQASEDFREFTSI